MDPMGPQLAIVGEISVMLAGAYPLVYFIRRYFGKAIQRLATLLHIDDMAALGMVVSLANPLPMYSLLDKMSPNGRVLCSAFSAPVLCLIGDHLGFISAVYPEGIVPLLAGKLLAAAIALVLAIAIVYHKPNKDI